MTTERETKNQNLVASKVFWVMQDELESGSITEVEAIGILDKLREYFLNDAVHHLTIMTKEEIVRCKKN